METINTNITPPADFIKKVKTYKIRFDLVKKNFEDSYDDYKKGADFGKKNVRNRKKKFRWKLVSFEDSLIEIKVEFDNPRLISNRERDFFVIVFNNTESFLVPQSDEVKPI